MPSHLQVFIWQRGRKWDKVGGVGQALQDSFQIILLVAVKMFRESKITKTYGLFARFIQAANTVMLNLFQHLTGMAFLRCSEPYQSDIVFGFGQDPEQIEKLHFRLFF